MQEVFFRLKDKEDSWETMAHQFPGTPANADALQQGIPASQIEAPYWLRCARQGPGWCFGHCGLMPTLWW